MTIRLLTTGQSLRLKYELGANLLQIGAEPYVQHQAIFDVVVANLYSDASAIANCSTGVGVVGSVVLTLDSMVGMVQGEGIILDYGAETAERQRIKSVAGSTITVNCQRLHTATFPVEVESGLTRVLMKLDELDSLERNIIDATLSSGVTQAGEVKLAEGENDSIGSLQRRQERARLELASIVNLRQVLAGMGFRRGGGYSLA